MSQRGRPDKHSPMKITLNHPIYRTKKNPLIKQQNEKQNILLDAQEAFHLVNQDKQRFKKTYFVTQQCKNGFFHGQVNKQSPGIGIFIDDSFNFFLSHFQNHHKMNGLSFVKLFNQTMIFGTWIHGKSKGWVTVQLSPYTLFIQSNSYPQAQKTIIVINYDSKIAYQLRMKQKTYFRDCQKIEVINRIQLIKQKYNISKTNIKNRLYNPNQIFPYLSLDIPTHQFNFSDFLFHFSQNNKKINFSDININRKYRNQHQEDYFILSIQIAKSIIIEDQQRKYKNEFLKKLQMRLKDIQKRDKQLKDIHKNNKQLKDIHKHNKLVTIKNKHKLALILQKESFKTKSIGMFNQNNQLNGFGLTIDKDNQKLCGIFNKNLIIHQYNYTENSYDIKQNPISNQIRKLRKNQHIKSLNYINEVIYFGEINTISKLTNTSLLFVKQFQSQYLIRFQQQSFQINQCLQNDEKSKSKSKYTRNIQSVYAGKIKSYDNKKKQQRFGIIVKSRSPIRQNRRTLSPNIQSFRQAQPPSTKINKTYEIKQMTSNRTFHQQNENISHRNQTFRMKPLNFTTNNLIISQQTTSTNRKYIESLNMESSRYKDPYFKRINYQNGIQQVQTVRLKEKQPKRQIFWKK